MGGRTPPSWPDARSYGSFLPRGRDQHFSPSGSAHEVRRTRDDKANGVALGQISRPFQRGRSQRDEHMHVGPVGHGDGLVLFTDGVTDVGPSPDEFFDVTGLERTVLTLWTDNARRICDGVLEEVVRRAGSTLPDDATVVVVKFE